MGGLTGTGGVANYDLTTFEEVMPNCAIYAGFGCALMLMTRREVGEGDSSSALCIPFAYGTLPQQRCRTQLKLNFSG